MDKIKIKDLELYCRHGVFPEENVLGQKFLFSAILSVDTRAPGNYVILSRSLWRNIPINFWRRFWKIWRKQSCKNGRR